MRSLYLIQTSFQKMKTQGNIISVTMKSIILLSSFILVFSNNTLALPRYVNSQKEVNELNRKSSYFKVINSDSSFYFASKALNIATKIEYDYGQIEALNNLGEYHLDRGDLLKANSLFEQSINLSKAAKEPYLEAISKSKKAVYFYFIGDYDSALIILDEKVIENLHAGNKQEYANILNLQSYIFTKKGNYIEALENRYEVLNIRIELGDENEIAKSYNALGDFYKQQRNYYKALNNYIKSYETSKKSSNLKGEGISLSNIAEIYFGLTQYEKSLEYHLKAIEVKNKIRSNKEIGISYKGLGKVYSTLQQYDSALFYFVKALSIFEKTANKPLYGENIFEIGTAKYHQKQYDSAEYYFSISEQVGNEIGNNDLLLKTYNAQSKLFLTINEAEKLKYSYNNYIQLADSLKITKNLSNILELQAKFEDDFMKREIAKVEDEKEITEKLLESANLQKSLLTTLSIISFLFFCVVTFFLVYGKKKSLILKKHNEQINNQNEKLIQLNNRLKISEIELQKINNTKDKLFAIISHDVRSPLNSLSGLLEVITHKSEHVDSVKMKELFKSLKDKLTILNTFLNNLLDWARIQNDEIKVKYSILDLEEIIQEIVELYSFQAELKKIKLETNLQIQSKIVADKNMLQFILRNLLANAIKFSHQEKSIEIIANQVDCNAIVTIKDYGIGIKNEELNNLFDIKHQVTKPGTYNEKGTGLGLILSKEFVEKNNGALTVESEYGKGSSFSFSIPMSSENIN